MAGVSTRRPRRGTGEEMRTVVVTGGNRGIGLAAARDLAGRGCNLILVCRDERRGRAALESLPSPRGRGGHRLVVADLASLASVREGAGRIAETGVPISALVNNAAVLPPKRRTSADGFELQLAVTHLGHFLLTNLLLDRLRAAPAPSRVVTVASAAHAGPPFDFRDPSFERRRYRRRRAYQQSKLANVLFSLALARRVAGSGVQAVALHPGTYETELLHDFLGGIPGGGALGRIAGRRVEVAGPIVGELAAGRRDEELNGLYLDKGVRARPSAAARDRGAQERLWRWSAEAVGLEAPPADAEAGAADAPDPPLR